jgi:hypothetical protein
MRPSVFESRVDANGPSLSPAPVQPVCSWALLARAPGARATLCTPSQTQTLLVPPCLGKRAHIAVAHFESALKTQDGRQIVATRAIANESALLEIPSALHMSVKQLRAHALLGKPRLSFSLSLIPTVLFLVV